MSTLPPHSRAVPDALLASLVVLVYLLGGSLTGCAKSPPDVATTSRAISSTNGVTINGAGSNGLHFNGLNLNGLHFNGQTITNVVINGLHFNSLELNGLHFNGLHFNGLHFNGLHFNGLHFNGLHFNGLHFNGLHFNGLHFNGAPLTAAEADALEHAVAIMAECALTPSESITVYDLDEVAHTFHGVVGLDPGFDTGVPDLTRYDVMAQCMIDRGAAAGHTVTHQAVNIETFKTVLRYLIECALPAGDTVTLYDENDAPIDHDGALGLAPEWKTGPMATAGRQLVSACLAARTNALGKTVQISLRGGGLPVGVIEQRLFTRHEGAFAADLFSPTPYVKSCDVSGGISGRTCASNGATCGFTPLGDCANTCTEIGDTGVFSDCDSTIETHVISTFLALERSVAFGKNHTCLRNLDGSVACWGDNAHGQLGTGAAGGQELDAPQPVAGLPDQSDALTSSYLHTCARGADGELHCWGNNGKGQLGDGTTTSQPAPNPVTALGLDVAAVSAADDNTCAVTTSGALWCWGANDYGQLGDGTSVDQLTPQQVPGYAGAVKVAVGRHTCALNSAGDVSCWGHNDTGQVGDDTTTNRSTPVPIVTGTAVDVCVGYRHTCALHHDGAVQCWGDNAYGQLGDGTLTPRSAPSPVIGLFADATAIGCGYDHTCARLDNGTLWCWGSNGFGQVGEGAPTLRENIPVQVVDIVDVSDVIAGRNYTCAELTDGSLTCWGRNAHGQLGDGTTVDAAQPVAVSYYSCGDDQCDPAAGEDRLNCPADCAMCGDGSCDATEDCDACASDCGTCGCTPCQIADCASCGVSPTGTCNTCTVTDCALCAGPICGDLTCDPSEDCTSCAWDCGACQTCAAAGEWCDDDSDCCSGNCRTKKNTCKA